MLVNNYSAACDIGGGSSIAIHFHPLYVTSVGSGINSCEYNFFWLVNIHCDSVARIVIIFMYLCWTLGLELRTNHILI